MSIHVCMCVYMCVYVCVGWVWGGWVCGLGGCVGCVGVWVGWVVLYTSLLMALGFLKVTSPVTTRLL